MRQTTLSLLAERTLKKLEKLTRLRAWTAIAVLIAILISFGCRLPNYQQFADFIHTPYGEAKQYWLNHPFKEVPVELFFPQSERHIGFHAGIASHLDKMTFRAFLPLLNQIFPWGIWTVVLASHIAAVVILLLTYLITIRQTSDRVSATLLMWAIAACYAGQYGFQDHYLGDAVAVSLLMFAMFTEKRGAGALSMFCAFLTDERALFAAPLVLYHHIEAISSHQDIAETARNKGAKGIAIATFASIAVSYILLRQIITFITGAETGTSMLFSREILRSNIFDAYPERVFKVFEFAWIIPIGYTIEKLVSEGNRRFSLFWTLALALAAFPAYMVVDIDRSMLYLMPAVITAFCCYPATQKTRRRSLTLITACSLAWLYPSLSALRLIANIIPGS